MKVKSYLSTQLEVIAALNGSLSKLIVPVKPQPVISRKLTQFGGGRWGQTYGLKKGAVTWDYDIPVSGGLWASGTANGPWVAPYPPESQCYFREAWAYEYGEPGFLYKASHEHMEGTGGRLFDRWYAAGSMPREAARIYATLGVPLVKRVQEVTEEEAGAMGCKKMKIDDVHWHTYRRGLQAHFDLRHPGSWERNEWVFIIPVTIESINGKPKQDEPKNH